MTLLKDAIRHYHEQHYAQALALFEQAGAVYGRKAVDLNIRMCRKALGSADPLAAIPDVGDARKLDPSTRVLLASVGKLVLSDQDPRVRQLRSQVLVFARAHFQKCHYSSANCSGAAGFSIPKA
jgi:hypothetical protein